MRIQLLLPAVLRHVIRDVFLAAYTYGAHLRNALIRFFQTHVISIETSLFIKAGSAHSFSHARQYPFQKLAGVARSSVDYIVKLKAHI
jgi:hypothetical protein